MFDWEQVTADFRQKFEHTYIRVSLKEGQPFEVFYVDRVVQGKPTYLVLSNSNWGEIKINYDTELEVLFDFPRVGYFNFNDKYAAIFNRNFQRQWKRGLCNQTGLICFPYWPFRNYLPLLCEEAITAAFQPRSICPIYQAANTLEFGSYLSVPLSESLALGLTVKENNNLLLWFLEQPIGEYIKEKNTIKLHAAQMQQEVKDFLTQTGEDVAIIC